MEILGVSDVYFIEYLTFNFEIIVSYLETSSTNFAYCSENYFNVDFRLTFVIIFALLFK